MNHAARPASKAAHDRPIVFLQGPVGGFFGFLTKRCVEDGIAAVKVQFNAADRLCDATPHALTFRGAPEQLPAWYDDLFARVAPRAIVMFGDCRAIHVAARHAAQRHGVPVFSFEEGYIRPTFVTFERDGNNARSPLALSDCSVAPELTSATEAPLQPSFVPMAFKAARYYLLLNLGRPAFPRYRHHRNRGIVSEFGSWIRSYLRKLAMLRREARIIQALLRDHRKNCFVVALQVYDDLQLRFHAAGWTTRSLIETSMRVFARNAPPEARLCIKQHPLDRGHVNYRNEVGALGRELGIEDRVHYLAGGDMPNLLAEAAGLVTINSTIAIGALFHGCPVFTCGDAFYRFPGLVADGRDEVAMARFFRDPPPVDGQIAANFRATVIARSQIRGSYYLNPTWPDMYSAFIKLVRTAS